MASPKAVQTKRSQPQTAESNVPPSRPPESSAAGSTTGSSEKIRETAYYKWEAAGCPSSDGVEFWLQAECELSADSADNRPAKPR